MKLIESKAEYIPQEEGLEGIYKQIELAGRTAYHSQDKITSDSAKDFVDRMIKSKHGACLEHGTVYLRFSNTKAQEGYCGMRAFDRYRFNPYSKISYDFAENKNNKYDGYMYIVTNYRVLVENNWLDDLKYICSPTEFHEKRYTMRFTCSRAIANELVRHRVFSFLQESTRYINYFKERHGGEITFIIPSWYGKYSAVLLNKEGYRPDGTSDMFISEEDFESQLRIAESCYMAAMIAGVKPQEARDVLPNATKTELIMTGFSSDWKRLLRLRLFEETGKVHPDMKVLMEKLKAECIKNEIWDDIINSDCKKI